MELGAVESQLRSAGAILVHPRLLRRVILAHRNLAGFGLQVPHGHCYGLGREQLAAIVGADELGAPVEQLPEQVVLIARPPPSRLAGQSSEQLLARFWRTVYHVRVHLELERVSSDGTLSEAMIRQRIDQLGQTEFDEIRAILKHDDLLLPPGGDREQYTEFVALYLELKYFAPVLLETTFPGLSDYQRVDEVIAQDIDAHGLLALACPAGAQPAATVVRGRAPSTTAGPASPSPRRGWLFRLRTPRSRRSAKRLIRAANAAKGKGNDVRSALLHTIAATALEPKEVQDRIRDDLRSLSARFNAALSPRGQRDSELEKVQHSSLFGILIEQAAESRAFRYPVEARLLYDLQLAAVAHERQQSAVDVITWARSRGRKPVVRPLPATREVRVARHVRDAASKVRHTRLEPPDRKLLAKVLRWATERADRNVRLALRPPLLEALSEVGLVPGNTVERLARDKLVEELLDRIVQRGFFAFTHLRDALSRNQLKLDDLSGGRELLTGDALLRIDRLLTTSLDGVYRGGEVYLRGLQR